MAKPARWLPEMIQARALMGFAELVAEQGGDPLRLLAARDIPPAALAEPDLPVSLDCLAELYDDAAAVLGLQDFGLRLSRYQDLDLYGPLALIARHSQTVGEALEGFARHFAYHTPGARIDIDPHAGPGWLAVRYQLHLSPGVPERQIIEQSYAMAAKIWRMLVPADAGTPRILLRHDAALPIETCHEYFGCPVLFGQAQDAILLPQAAMSRLIDQADAALHDSSEAFVRSIIQRYPLDLARQVQGLLAQQLAFGGATIRNVAGQLKMHKRTLQRRLAGQGLFFEDILDRLRKEQAFRYLAEQQRSPGEVSAMLGYNEQSSFVRACRRWFGQTPKAIRGALPAMADPDSGK